eukprot:6191746-Pleurochrysis_carterae.AAC.4
MTFGYKRSVCPNGLVSPSTQSANYDSQSAHVYQRERAQPLGEHLPHSVLWEEPQRSVYRSLRRDEVAQPAEARSGAAENECLRPATRLAHGVLEARRALARDERLIRPPHPRQLGQRGFARRCALLAPV